MAEVKTISEIIEDISGRKPETEHKIVYETYAESLEPVYYFVLDLMNDFGLAPEKLVDNFSPSPGSTQFAEFGAKATAMQQQISQSMGNINVVLKSVLNIIYDLKDFKIRLKSYDDVNSKNSEIVKAARLSLKQIWMDKVDINRGNSSIKGLAISQGGAFSTLIDAFLVADSVKDITHKLDLNDVVKRILIPRVQEFNLWIKESERALRTRYELEVNYLKSQVNTLKLYSRWAKPYLIAAKQLEQKMSKNAALVSSFNRTILELTLLGKSKVKSEEILPPHLKKKKMKRDYHSCILVDFMFSAVPLQGAKYIGKVEVTFRAYALNDDELKMFEQELKKSDGTDVLRLIEGITDESLKEMQDDIDFFLSEKESEKEKEKVPDNSNPFLALLGFYDKKPEKKQDKKPEEKEITEIKKDTWLEKEHLRKAAAEVAEEKAFTLFDVYKKAHGMPSYT